MLRLLTIGTQISPKNLLGPEIQISYFNKTTNYFLGDKSLRAEASLTFLVSGKVAKKISNGFFCAVLVCVLIDFRGVGELKEVTLIRQIFQGGEFIQVVIEKSKQFMFPLLLSLEPVPISLIELKSISVEPVCVCVSQFYGVCEVCLTL